MIPMPIWEALIKSGVLGAVLAWSLLWNMRNTERLFTTLEANTKAMVELAQALKDR